MKILISGATGLVGSALTPFLAERGHQVVRLSRSGRPGTVYWNPAGDEIDATGLMGVAAVIHLAGANLADGRWTASRKQEIRRSRVDGTRLLVTTLAQLPEPPQVLVSASAIGYYGDTGGQSVDEAAPVGQGFLADLCLAWEAEAMKAAHFGARVTLLRSGVVLSRAGGALAKMLPIFRAGLGGRIGSGRQWVSWIALDDLLEGVAHVLGRESAGPINVVAPGAVTNADFTATLARVLGRPAGIPVPATALKLAYGEMAKETLLASCRVVPARLEAEGFRFKFSGLESALRHALSGD